MKTMKQCWIILLVAYTAITAVFCIGKQPQIDKYRLATRFLKDNTDWFFDKFLSEFKRNVRKNLNNELHIGNIKGNIAEHMFGISLSTTYTAKNVVLRDISTITRIGEADLYAKCEGFLLGNDTGITFILSTGMSLKDFHIIFDYSFNIWKFDADGSSVIKVKDNLIYVEFEMILQPKCSVRLHTVRVEKLGEIEVDITGMSLAGPFVGLLSPLVVEGLLNVRKNSIQTAIFQELQNASNDINICRFLPLPLS